MHSISFWKLSRPPNYDVNVNKLFPYSEVPYIGEYNLVRLPLSTDLIDLVDYWGEGRIVTKVGSSGFPDCYNVNHHYQLVSNGPDRDRKIPNRIPVISYTNCGTSSYIKDNSVKVVTLMGAPINKSCAKDIVRLVNSEVGKVIVYGFNESAADIKNIGEALKMKDILYCMGYELPLEFQGATLFDSHRAYLNLTELKEELYKNVTRRLFENCIEIAKTLENSPNGGQMIAEAVSKMLKDAVVNLTEFAYKLWINGAEGKKIVNEYFPSPFQLIFSNVVKLLNRRNLGALALEKNKNNSTKQAVADAEDKSSNKVQWKLVPVWGDDNIYFKFLNKEYQDYLKAEDSTMKILGSEVKGDAELEEEYMWRLEPFKLQDDVVFNIVNKKYNCGLILELNENVSLGSQSTCRNSKPFGWFVSTPQ